MKIISAEFVTSAAAGGTSAGIPRDGLPQIAMAGRSNVGKSALINALVRRPIARTSAAPGKTRLANVYRLSVEGGGPGRWSLYLVDLPGYGYARAPRQARDRAEAASELAAVAESYLTAAKPNTVLLVDSRHPGLASDVQAHRWLRTLGIEPVIVATKIDKLTRAERVKNLRELERVFETAAVPVSAERGDGLDELWTSLGRMARATKEQR